ncbi:ABC transporter ATP-binding protein [Agitococcus lubricus]|uniref:Lipoprotein-releasing system ATP-binding protein n=1 Tax=Agitococcus lubricus TaxID=1077255 RepID=A0A2T5IWY4_9GAMM|nr:ABC transporter ATP-binding protein [Agitococcus lubricus]PTQ88423.1 lipoprotein-releasing system ATP-binding protein [Agitococcus lubricus]
MTSPLLVIEQLNRIYGSGDTQSHILKNISFSVAQGEFSALIGQSGSGKSTLLNQIGLLEQASSGSIRLAGQYTENLQDNERTALRNQTLGFVFQFHHLISAFNAIENVMMPMKIRGIPEAQLKKRAFYLLDKVGLAEQAYRFPQQLSGGQQQRVAIVRALMAQPLLVLADEPTGNLDSQTADQIFALLRTINQEDGTSFLIVTHDMQLAKRCDRQLVLKDGYLVSDSYAALP